MQTCSLERRLRGRCHWGTSPLLRIQTTCTSCKPVFWRQKYVTFPEICLRSQLKFKTGIMKSRELGKTVLNSNFIFFLLNNRDFHKLETTKCIVAQVELKDTIQFEIETCTTEKYLQSLQTEKWAPSKPVWPSQVLVYSTCLRCMMGTALNHTHTKRLSNYTISQTDQNRVQNTSWLQLLVIQTIPLVTKQTCHFLTMSSI